MDGFSVAFLLTGLTGFIQIGLNFLTAGWPTRPSWAAYGGALLIGIGGAFLFATANEIVLTDSVTAQLVIVGIFAAASAAGLSYQTIRAETKRFEAGEIQQRLNGPKV